MNPQAISPPHAPRGLDPLDWITLILRQWRVTAATVVIAAILAILATRAASPIYTTTATISVLAPMGNNGPDAAVTLDPKAIYFSIAELLDRPAFFERVIRKLTETRSLEDLEADLHGKSLFGGSAALEVRQARLGSLLRRATSFDAVGTSTLIQISVTGRSPEAAQALTAAVAGTLQEAAPALWDHQAMGSGFIPPVVHVLEAPTLPRLPSGPNLVTNVLVALVLGFALGIVLALYRGLREDLVLEAREIEDLAGLRCVAEIPSPEVAGDAYAVTVEALALRFSRAAGENRTTLLLGDSASRLAADVGAALAGRVDLTLYTDVPEETLAENLEAKGLGELPLDGAAGIEALRDALRPGEESGQTLVYISDLARNPRAVSLLLAADQVLLVLTRSGTRLEELESQLQNLSAIDLRPAGFVLQEAPARG